MTPVRSACHVHSDPRTHAILGALVEVHKTLGTGFLEAVYQEACAMEFAMRGVPFAREVPLPIQFKGQELTTRYRADFICFGTVLVELKAVGSLGAIEHAQVLNYLKATGLRTGLLVNFGGRRIAIQRLVQGWTEPEPIL